MVGKIIRLSDRPATVIGVLEPSVPYPQETEIIANVVTSPHHLDATMVDGRVHRMTEIFGRLAPDVDLDTARAELRAVHGAIIKEHPEAYQTQADFRIDAKNLRDQIIAPAKTILLILLAASGLVFIVACSNVANLILARSVRRQGELALRAALGASHWALRRTLLAESLLLCGAGTVLAIIIARPMVAVLASYAARFSVRAHDVTVDASLLWVGAGLAIAAAVLLAYIPKLPAAESTTGTGLVGRQRAAHLGHQPAPARLRRDADRGVVRPRRRRGDAHHHAVRAAASAHRIQGQRPGGERSGGLVHAEAGADHRFYKEIIRRISELPGVDRVALGTVVPWRDPGFFAAQFTAEGYQKANGEEDPRARFRTVSPGFFDALGVRIVAGRDFDDSDRRDGEKVVIISESVAKRMFPSLDAVNRRLMWTDPVMKFIDVSTEPRRIVGVAADMDDENLVPEPAMTVYHPMEQELSGGRLFIHAKVGSVLARPAVTKLIRDLAGDQPVERAATLDDIRAEVLAPNRVNALVFGGFAGVALLIAVVGVAGVLAFSVSARTREFGVRLAIGSTPWDLLTRVLREGAAIGVIGIVAGALGGLLLARVAGSFVTDVEIPGVVPIAGAATVLVLAAIIASLTPAARASRVDVVRALRAESGSEAPFPRWVFAPISSSIVDPSGRDIWALKLETQEPRAEAEGR